ncbi:MarR family winged helix-turn-helix transcriptional regulator [Nocardioides terrisoli]|uniref:MarR family winged helix-turn-helix transcriptional regulator n=1 Tax=Nocardioides terrisoli TaxID=3388267 RepID=UPI00287BA819|nr:MarR family transcriptional regulator [Nocardioides marmorisolisilvae]
MTTLQQPDETDLFIAQWRERRPDLDTMPMAVLGRLLRLAGLLENELRPVFAAVGLSTADFDVLATLRRWGRPMSPGELGRSVLVESGSVAKRLDRLSRRNLVHRFVDPHDVRGRLVELTPSGVSLTDELAERHWAHEDQMLHALNDSERTQLLSLLRRLLVAHE